MRLPSRTSVPAIPPAKTAGIADTGVGALLGAILGRIGSKVPALEQLRMSNPMAYDAALGAAVITAFGQIDTDDGRPDGGQAGLPPIPFDQNRMV